LSLFFDDLLDAKVREFNPRYAEAEGVPRMREQFRNFKPDIYGNREFVEQLRNRGEFFEHVKKWLRSVAKLTGGILERRVPVILLQAVRESPRVEFS